MKTGQLYHENPQRDCITLDRTRTEPVVRQIVAAKKMSLIDTARFMALTAVAGADPIDWRRAMYYLPLAQVIWSRA